MRAVMLTAALVIAVGCSEEPADELGRSGGPGTDPASGAPPGTDPAAVPPAPQCPGAGRPYLGIGGVDLRVSRVDAAAGTDRGRMKPYSSIGGELTRVVGVAPTSVPEIGAAQGETPRRWYLEPQGSAMAIYSSHRVAFDACLTMTATAPAYAAAPTAATAQAECARLATKAWSRRPLQEEVDVCVKLAVQDSASEPDVRRRWAATCAAVVSAAGFLTY
jgi:hypothetical protein